MTEIEKIEKKSSTTGFGETRPKKGETGQAKPIQNAEEGVKSLITSISMLQDHHQSQIHAFSLVTFNKKKGLHVLILQALFLQTH